jgi:hypothetical protein
MFSSIERLEEDSAAASDLKHERGAHWPDNSVFKK